MSLTYERASELLSYAPESGELRWRVAASNGVKPGDIAGTLGELGYRHVQIGRKRYRAHRLAWLLTHGELPPSGIDHINGDKTDNRLANLRLATQAENLQNLGVKRNNTSGHPGVSWFKPVGKWRARIVVARKEHSLGYFDSLEQAAAAYIEAKTRLHTFQPTVRTA